ncbi:XisI protein [Pannus brasiliensis CCIBt3594]|uniref:XisI protein n=1 Tax=Pannus brasiliensis CCIBt3594 TaxID=1427578 RepID=A0AAW9QTY5_9CHRO
MDKLDYYRRIAREIFIEHSEIKPAHGEIQMKPLFDETRDRYQLLRAGWIEEERVYGALIPIDLEDDKIWIQYDGTEVGVANELLEKGVPREDIVLAYHSPLTRQYDGLAVC